MPPYLHGPMTNSTPTQFVKSWPYLKIDHLYDYKILKKLIKCFIIIITNGLSHIKIILEVPYRRTAFILNGLDFV